MAKRLQPQEMVQVGSYSTRFKESMIISSTLYQSVYADHDLAHKQILLPSKFIAECQRHHPAINLLYCSRSTSPFWRNRPVINRNGSHKLSDPKMVVGASYSHADMLNFDSLYAPFYSPNKYLLTTVKLLGLVHL